MSTAPEAVAAHSRLYVKQSGQTHGLPPIILEAGAAATNACWGWIQRRISERTLVVSYDRAGLGQSDVRGSGRDTDAAAASLETLLAELDLAPPYILVGHSLGGLIVQRYAALHTETTAALVLIDPTPADRSLLPRGHDRFASLYFGLLRILQGIAWTGALRIYNPLARIAQRSGLPPCDIAAMIAALASSRHIDTVIRELKSISTIQDAVNKHPILQDIPVMVVSAGVRTQSPASAPNSRAQARFYAAVLEKHKDMAKRSASGRHVLIQSADHNTLLTQKRFAEEVADHILDFADQVAAHR